MSKLKILIGTPTYDGTIHVSYMETVLTLMQAFGESDIQHEWMTVKGSLVDIARNTIASRVIRYESFSHLLFIDSDIGFDAEAMAALVLNCDLPVVGLACPLKEYPPRLNIKKHTEGSDRFGVSRVRTIGTGALLIRAYVLSDLALKSPEFLDMNGDRCWELFKSGVGPDGRYKGEDVYFCDLCATHGHKIYVANNAKVTHTGQHCFSS